MPPKRGGRGARTRCCTCGNPWRNPHDPLCPFRNPAGYRAGDRRRRLHHQRQLHRREVHEADRPGVDAGSGLTRAEGMRGAARRLFRRKAPQLRSAAGARRHAVSEARVARDRAGALRRDPHVLRARRTRGRRRIGARRRRRHRPQPDRRHRALPPHRGLRRQPHRVRGRAGAQDEAAGDRRRAAGVAGLRPADLARLVALAAMWGGSYLFMRYAVPYFGPVPLIELRVLIAGLALTAYQLATGGTVGWRRHWKDYLFVGGVGLAVPFVLIAEALTTIDASTAAILNALAPLFASIVAAVWIRDPVTPAKLAGIALCLAGTAVLVGWTPAPMTGRELLAASMSIAATAIYGYTIVFTKVYLKDASPLGTAAGTLLMAAVALMPFLALSPAPQGLAAIPAMAWLAMLGLAIVSTTVAFIFYYRLIADVGPVKAITVTLLVPIFAMLVRVAFLGEPVTPGRLAGCAIILAGCALILGLVRLPIRRPAS